MTKEILKVKGLSKKFQYNNKDIIVLKKGKIVESGSCKNIIKNPKHSYTKNLINASTNDWFAKKNNEN